MSGGCLRSRRGPCSRARTPRAKDVGREAKSDSARSTSRLAAMASTFLTHQARVLLAVANDCNVRMRDLANQVGLTERAVYDALSQLIEDGYLERERVGRRNCYRLALEPKDGGAAEVEAVRDLAQLLQSKVGS